MNFILWKTKRRINLDYIIDIEVFESYKKIVFNTSSEKQIPWLFETIEEMKEAEHYIDSILGLAD